MERNLSIKWGYPVFVLIVALITVYFQLNDQLFLVLLSLIGLAVVTYAIFSFSRLEKLLNALIFLAPISFSLELVGGFSLKTPLEVLAIFVVFLFLTKVLLGLSMPKMKWYHPAFILIILELAWIFAAALNSEMLNVSLKRVALKGLFITSFFVMFSLIKTKRKEELYSLFGWGLLVPIILTSIMHARYGFSQNTSFSIARPFFDDHTQYGAIVAFVIPFFLINLKREKGGLNTWYLIITLFLFFAVITSYSRGAWISLIAALLFYLLLKLRMKFTSLMTIIGIGAIALTFNFNTIYDGLRKNEIKYANDVSQHLTSVTNLQNDASNLERINRWVCAYRMFEAKPVFGYGPGTYQFFYDLYQTPEYMTRISTHEGDKGNAHSEFFNALSEQGLIGAIINITLMIYMVYLGMKAYYNQIDPKDQKVILAAILGLITFYVHGLFNTFSDIAEMSLLIYGSMSIIIFYRTNGVVSKA